MTQIHVSLDLETWGTTPGCDIRSIGACVFVPHTGAVSTPDRIQLDKNYPQGSFYIACDNPPIGDGRVDQRYKYNLTRDPRTVAWWNDQSAEAQAAFTDPVDLREALERFGDWLHSITQAARFTEGYPVIATDQWSGLRIWSHGAAFDPPILAAAYAACGLPVPWHYRAPRDTRTLFDAAGVDDHSAWLAARPGPLGVSHHALDDAICQARGVCDAWALIRT